MDNMIVRANIKMQAEISELKKTAEDNRIAKEKYQDEVHSLKKQLKAARRSEMSVLRFLSSVTANGGVRLQDLNRLKRAVSKKPA